MYALHERSLVPLVRYFRTLSLRVLAGTVTVLDRIRGRLPRHDLATHLGVGRRHIAEALVRIGPDAARAVPIWLRRPRDWALRGWVRARQVPPRGLSVVWADGRERQRLWGLRAASRRGRPVDGAPSRESVIR
jgi:hypothetical protein